MPLKDSKKQQSLTARARLRGPKFPSCLEAGAVKAQFTFTNPESALQADCDLSAEGPGTKEAGSRQGLVTQGA